MDVKAIILDFDGVLVESNDVKTAAFADLFGRYPGHERAMMEYHLAHQALSRLHKFEYFAAELFGRPGDQALIREMLDGFSSLVEQRVAACPDVPGALDFLEEFHRRVPLYLSSHTPEDELRRIVTARGLDKYFRKVFGYPPMKKTAAMAEIFEMEKVRPEECLFIGDSPSDENAAQECGVPFLARDSGLWLDGSGPARLRDMHEIAAAVRQRMERV